MVVSAGEKKNGESDVYVSGVFGGDTVSGVSHVSGGGVSLFGDGVSVSGDGESVCVKYPVNSLEIVVICDKSTPVLR